jgi:para-aminobenzoate synthetase component I
VAPISFFESHARAPWPFVLDRAASVSFAGSRPSTQLIVEATGRVRLWKDGAWHEVDAHPIDAIDDFVTRSEARAHVYSPEIRHECLPRTVGYLAYELGAFVEEVPVAGLDPAGAPLAILSTYDRVEAWFPGARIPVVIEFEAAQRSGTSSPPAIVCAGAMEALTPRDAGACWRSGFARIRAGIRAGDIYQANLSRRIDFPFDGDALDAYARLRHRQPVPYGAYLDLGARQILSNSPECFLSVRGDEVETRPIKGTRARHADPRLDRRALAALCVDAKERAEHLMIVDLERSDLGRVCRPGSVEVATFASVESFATVHHLVSSVRGVLSSGATLASILRATFPGGSITGAPKIRAMQIIAEVEPQARGVYTGAIGCFNGPRALELNVAIRTAVAGGGRIHYCTGGGIVADSTADVALEETEIKARAFVESVGEPDGATRAAV